MIPILDWSSTSSPTRIPPSQSKLKRNTLLGTTAGIASTALLLAKGKPKNFLKMEYDTKAVMALCSGAAIGGHVAANITEGERNKKGRQVELRNQLVFNDAIPLFLFNCADKMLKIKSKLVKSIALIGALLGATWIGHKLAEVVMKKEGLKSSYPIRASHLLADADDMLLPVAVATKSSKLQQGLKLASPITYAPLGMNAGLAKDEDYFFKMPCKKNN